MESPETYPPEVHEPEESADRFIEFFDRIKRAQGEAAVGWLTTIGKAARRDWKAGAWLLAAVSGGPDSP